MQTVLGRSPGPFCPQLRDITVQQSCLFESFRQENNREFDSDELKQATAAVRASRIHIGMSRGYVSRIASASIVMATSSPTITPPRSRVSFQLTPKS